MEADKPVATLTEKDMEVRVAGELNPRTFVAKKVDDNVRAVNTVFEISVDGKIEENEKVKVVLKTGSALTQVPQTPVVEGNAQTSVSKPQAQVDTVTPMIDVTTEGVDSSVISGGAVYFKLSNAGTPVDGLQNVTFKDEYGFDVTAPVVAGNDGVYKATSGLTAGKTYKVLVEGTEVGTLKVVASTAVKLSAADTTVNVLATDAETTITLEGAAKGAEIVVSDSAIQTGTDTKTVTKDGVTATVEGDKLKISGTPITNTTAREFHVGIKGTTTEATFTVNVEKVKKADVTVEATLSNGNDGATKNKDIILILKKDNTPLTEAQMTSLGLDTTTSKYTVTNDNSKTVASVKIENGKITISLNAALDGGKKITKIATQATDFAEAFEYTSELNAHA